MRPFNCVICKSVIDSRNTWLQHLPESCHQSSVRVACRKWGRAIQERCFVAYCNFNAGSSDLLLKWFSEGSTSTTPVSDFVWGSETPTIAIVVLESSQAVFDFLSEHGGETDLSIRNSDYRVRLRRGVEVVGLQWSCLLQSFSLVDMGPSPRNNLEAPNYSTIIRGKVIPKPGIGKKRKMSENVPNPLFSLSSSQSSTTTTPSTSTASQPISYTSLSLNVQLKSVCDAMKVPENQCEVAQNIVSVLEMLLQNQYGGSSVHIFRTWHLQLKHDYYYGDGEYLVLYVTNRIPSLDHRRDLRLRWKSKGEISLDAIRTEILGSQLFPNIQIGRRFLLQSGFQFNIVTDDTFLIETQLNRMIQYLCKFDQRLIPLITLVRHWAKLHNVMLQEDNELFVSYYCLGDPTALEWMVIIFMCREGLIPTPRDLQTQPHRKVPLPDVDDNVDIGFTEDPDFITEWNKRRTGSLIKDEPSSDEFALSVVKLAQQFFSLFGSALASGSWILNTRDGLLISTNELLLKGDPVPAYNPCQPDTPYILVGEELKILKSLRETGGRGENDSVDFADTYLFRVYVVNPLYFRWRLSLCNRKLPRVCEIMTKTGEALRTFVDNYRTKRQGGYMDLCAYLLKS